MKVEEGEGATDTKPSDVNGIPWEIYKKTPGIYPIGSDSDNAMLEMQEPKHEWPIGLFSAKGPLADYGAWQEDTANLAWRKTAPICSEEGHPLLKLMDAEFMRELDKRLRVCRAILANSFPLRWAADGEPEWTIENPPDGHPFDVLGSEAGLNAPVSTPQYFALKILRHWRRFEGIADLGGNATQTGVIRELILFGETWAEARTIIRLGGSIVTGAKQRKYLKNVSDGQNKRAKKAVQKRRAAIALLIDSTNLKGGALENWLVKQLKNNNKIQTSTRTIRDDLKFLRGKA